MDAKIGEVVMLNGKRVTIRRLSGAFAFLVKEDGSKVCTLIDNLRPLDGTISYAIEYALGERRLLLVVRAQNALDAYDQARKVLASTYPSASIQGTARPASADDVDRAAQTGLLDIGALVGDAS